MVACSGDRCELKRPASIAFRAEQPRLESSAATVVDGQVSYDLITIAVGSRRDQPRGGGNNPFIRRLKHLLCEIAPPYDLERHRIEAVALLNERIGKLMPSAILQRSTPLGHGNPIQKFPVLVGSGPLCRGLSRSSDAFDPRVQNRQ